MKLTLKDETETVVRLSLEQDSDGTVNLIANGTWYLLEITPVGVIFCQAIPESLGFKLENNGELVVLG